MSINQLAQPVTDLLDRANVLDLMRKDWETINIKDIREQATWTCECREEVIAQLGKFINSLEKILVYIYFSRTRS